MIIRIHHFILSSSTARLALLGLQVIPLEDECTQKGANIDADDDEAWTRTLRVSVHPSTFDNHGEVTKPEP